MSDFKKEWYEETFRESYNNRVKEVGGYKAIVKRMIISGLIAMVFLDIVMYVLGSQASLKSAEYAATFPNIMKLTTVLSLSFGMLGSYAYEFCPTNNYKVSQ